MVQFPRGLDDDGQPPQAPLTRDCRLTPRPPVLVLMTCEDAALSPGDQGHLVMTLRRGGWLVYAEQPGGNWAERLEEVAPDVLLVRSGAAQAGFVTHIIGLVKGRGQGVCVVAQFGAVAPGLRIAALKAGADICLSLPDAAGPWLAAELLAVVEASRRSRSLGLSRGWTLNEARRCLLGPQGISLSLTPVEGKFLSRLFASPGCCLRRSESGNGEQSRRLDVMVSRLRSKARQAGVDLPLRAVRHWGYIFLAELTDPP